MSTDITFCNNRQCPKKDCLRYYDNAPFNVLLSWFHATPIEEKCEYYIKTEREEI